MAARTGDSNKFRETVSTGKLIAISFNQNPFSSVRSPMSNWPFFGRTTMPPFTIAAGDRCRHARVCNLADDAVQVPCQTHDDR